MYVLVFGKDAIVIDPCVSWNKTGLSDLNIRAVLCTHGHFDHVSEFDEYAVDKSVPVFISEKDKPMISDPDLNHSSDFGLNISGKGEASVLDKDLLSNDDFGIEESFTMKVISTPGHTPGSVCFLFTTEDDRHFMFTGDMLFAGSVGRTDLGGSFKDMEASIQLLSSMQDEIDCYPGHGDKTVLGLEKRFNPFFRSL